VAKAVRLSRRRSSRCSPAGATSAATARAHIRCKDAFPRRTILLCHRWWPLQESVFFALEGEPVLDAGHALYCSTYYSRAVSVARSHSDEWRHLLTAA
jgi:hypothetical protein